MKRYCTAAAFVVAGLGVTFGASEAYAGRSSLGQATCPTNYNWCAPSLGGQDNCNTCCNSLDSICYDRREVEDQGCLCG